MLISEVSKKFGLSADTLRYYEKINLIPPVNRDKNGIRNYDEDDLLRVNFVVCMRKAGLPIKALQEYFRLLEIGDSTLEKRRDILLREYKNLNKKIDELLDTKEMMKHKIENYDRIIEKEKELK